VRERERRKGTRLAGERERERERVGKERDLQVRERE
jgi:hypothetical protein